MTALLAKQGLRPTRAGGMSPRKAVETQLGRNNKVVRPFQDLRRRRNESEYPSTENPPVTEHEALDGLEDARGTVTAMKSMLPHVDPWRP